jgi:hypothetical protein
MKKIFMMLAVVFLLIMWDVTNPSASSIENRVFEQNKGAMKHVEKINKGIEQTFGSLKRFEDVGGVYFDEKGIVHVGVKYRTAVSTELVKSIGEVVGERYVVLEKVTYSTTELDNLKESILKDIKSSLAVTEYKTSSFTIDASFKDQNLVITYGSKGLPDDLIQELKTKYKDILLVEEANFEISPNKARTEDWNQQISGLGITMSSGSKCSTGSIFYKNGNYFISTAGHCFGTAATSPTGGALVNQYSLAIGRQHADGRGKGYDIGLVRITTDSTLPGGRYATNKLKRYNSVDTYDANITSWSSVYTGQYACKSGITTDYTCGVVTSANTTVKYPTQDYTFNVAKVAGTDWSKPGDSGAGVYNSSGTTATYLGNVSGNYTLNGVIQGGFFTKFSDVANSYDVALYISNTNYKVVD